MFASDSISRTSCLAVAALMAVAACRAGGSSAALAGRPDSLAFEPLAVGRLSAAQIVEWSNVGADTIRLTELSVTGPAAADFIVAEDLCAGATLALGESCSVAILFGPREAGPRSASLGAGGAPAGTEAVVLFGEAIADTVATREMAGLVRAVPETLDFGQQPLGTPGGPLAVRLVNQRLGAVQFAVRLRGGPGAGYRIALDQCSNEILEPGRACTVRILFQPAAEGLQAGELILRDLIGPGVQSVPLSGSGVAALAAAGAPGAGEAGAALGTAGAETASLLQVRPRAVEFGVQTPGASSPARAVVIGNGGAGNVTFRSLRVAGDDASDFRITQDGCSGGLVPTRTCSLQIVFEPAAPGAKTARIEVMTNSGLEPALVLLSGTAAARP